MGLKRVIISRTPAVELCTCSRGGSALFCACRGPLEPFSSRTAALAYADSAAAGSVSVRILDSAGRIHKASMYRTSAGPYRLEEWG